MTWLERYGLSFYCDARSLPLRCVSFYCGARNKLLLRGVCHLLRAAHVVLLRCGSLIVVRVVPLRRVSFHCGVRRFIAVHVINSYCGACSNYMAQVNPGGGEYEYVVPNPYEYIKRQSPVVLKTSIIINQKLQYTSNIYFQIVLKDL